MNRNNLSPKDEIKTFYTLFCEIFTAFHNYATAKRLFKNKIYSWSLISYYYSLMHCGRAICFLSLNCFPKRHEDLCKLLSGENITHQKFWKLKNPKGIREDHNFDEVISGLSGIIRDSDETKIVNLGQLLYKIKKVREFNSYEMFIVAHQIDHEVLSPKLENKTKIIGEKVGEYLAFVTDLLFNYVQKKPDCIKAFLLDKNQTYKWAFEYLTESLKKQSFDKRIINEIEEIIKERLLTKIGMQMPINCPDEFYREISFELFNEKSGIINNFIRIIEEVN